MKITHDYPVKVFSRKFNEKTLYSVGLSKKDADGKYVNGYIDAKFRKDIEVDSGKKIYIKDAWLDFYIDKDNKTRTYIFINQFEYVGGTIQETKQTDSQEESNATIYTEDIEITDEDLPF